MQLLEEIAIRRVLADSAANHRERKQKEQSLLTTILFLPGHSG
jgi:hypothetical protein